MTYQSLNPATGKLLKKFEELTDKELETKIAPPQLVLRPGGTRLMPSGRSSSPKRQQSCMQRPTSSRTR